MCRRRIGSGGNWRKLCDSHGLEIFCFVAHRIIGWNFNQIGVEWRGLGSVADASEGEDGAGGSESGEGVGGAELAGKKLDRGAQGVAKAVGVVVVKLGAVVGEVLAEDLVVDAPVVDGAAGDADGAGDGGVGSAAEMQVKGKLLARGEGRQLGGGGNGIILKSGKF